MVIFVLCVFCQYYLQVRSLSVYHVHVLQKPDEVSGENVIGSNPFLNPQPVSPVQETGDQRSAFHSGGENMETEDRLQTR